MDDDARGERRPGGAMAPSRPLASQDLIRLVMSQTTVGLILTDLETVVIDVNDAAARMMGRDPSDIRGMTVAELSHPEDAAVSTRLIEEVRAGVRDSYQVRRRWLHPDGTVVHAAITVAGVLGADDRPEMLFSQAVDVSALERAERDAQKSSQVLRGVIDTLMDPWVLMDAVRDDAGRIVDFVYRDANDAACRANRMSRAALLGRRFLDLLPGHVAAGLFGLYVDVVETGEPLALDDHPWASDLTDGRTRYFDNRAVRVGDGLSFTWRDVTTRTEQRQQLAVQALTDPLTGLSNRQRLIDAMEALCARSDGEEPCAAVLYCDLDGLKAINDTHGHEVGDRVLQAVARRMAAAVRGTDLVARIGGDEFVIVVEGVREDDRAMALAVKVADAVSRPLEIDGGTVTPTLSIGVALGRPGLEPSDVLRDADAAMFRQKREKGHGQTP